MDLFIVALVAVLGVMLGWYLSELWALRPHSPAGVRRRAAEVCRQISEVQQRAEEQLRRLANEWRSSPR